MYDKDTKFLIIDDLTGIRVIFRRILKSLEYTNVIEAADGKEAYDLMVQSLSENRPVQVVLSDLRMPNMDGIEFTKLVRSNAAFAKVPIIMISAENDRESILAAVKTGITEYMIKPITEDVILEKLESAQKKIASGS